MKTAGILLLISGAAAIVFSLVLTLFAMAVSRNAALGIIGGADGPTFWFLFSKTFLPLAVAGAVACITGLILLVLKK